MEWVQYQHPTPGVAVEMELVLASVRTVHGMSYPLCNGLIDTSLKLGSVGYLITYYAHICQNVVILAGNM